MGRTIFRTSSNQVQGKLTASVSYSRSKYFTLTLITLNKTFTPNRHIIHYVV